METYQLIALGLAAGFLMLYLGRRRGRMNRED
jgi:hypothetical protein